MSYEPSVAAGFSKNRFLAIVVLFGLLTAVAPAFAQTGSGRVRGRVTDEAGNPIAGVAVVASNPDVARSTLTGTTNDNGRWAIMGLKPNADWAFTFTKEGFIELEMNRTVLGMRGNANMDVTLTPLADDAGIGMIDTALPGVELFTEANAAMDAGDPVTAAAKYEEFLALNPETHLAYVNLGNAYREGYGVWQDDSTAVQWWLLAAEQGNSDAMYNLGIHYYYGRGVEIDKASAFEWFLTAADAGNEQARRVVRVELVDKLKETAVTTDESTAIEEPLPVLPDFAPPDTITPLD